MYGVLKIEERSGPASMLASLHSAGVVSASLRARRSERDRAPGEEPVAGGDLLDHVPGTGASVETTITCRWTSSGELSSVRPAAAETMLIPCRPIIVPTRPIIPGTSL